MEIYKEELKGFRADSQRNLREYKARKLAKSIKRINIKVIPRSIGLAIGITLLASQAVV